MKISKKIYSSIWNSDLNVFSSIIKKIASITIAIGLSSIILSVFILEGFKKEIKKKVYNFSGHYILFRSEISCRCPDSSIFTALEILAFVPANAKDVMIGIRTNLLHMVVLNY